MRRVVGGLIERTGDKQIDGNATVRQAITEATAAGLRLQCTANQAAAVQEENEAKRLEAARLLGKQVTAWRQLVVEGGPARVAALTEIREARRLDEQSGGSRGVDARRTGVQSGGDHSGVEQWRRWPAREARQRLRWWNNGVKQRASGGGGAWWKRRYART